MTYLSIGLAVVLLLAMFIAVIRRLVSRAKTGIESVEWLETFSMEVYAPMERLLDRSDFEFLAAQPGYRPEVGRDLLRERQEIFKQYLGMLVTDFNRLLGIAKFMAVFSVEDRSEFAKALWRQQAVFYFAVGAVRLRLAFYPRGWTALDVPRLVHALGDMRNLIDEIAARRNGPLTV